MNAISGAALLMTLATSAPAVDDEQRAKELFRQGTEKLERGEYREARVDYEKAYDLSKKAGFLWNIAECARLAGEEADALKHYRAYVHDAPKGSQRAKAEERVRELEKKLGTPAIARTSAAAPPPAPPKPPSGANATEPSTPPTQSIDLAPRSKDATKIATARTAGVQASQDGDSLPTTLPATSPVEPEIYETWWFWTIAGVVAAGAGAGVYFATRGDDTGGIMQINFR